MARPRKNLKLTLLQNKFIDAYMKCGMSGKAAREAGYSPISADAIGTELIKLPHVQREIEKRQKQLATKYESDMDRLIMEMKLIAFANIEDVIEWGEETVIISPGRDDLPEHSDSCPVCSSHQVFLNPVRGIVTCLACGWHAKVAAKELPEDEKRPPVTVRQSVLRLKASHTLSRDITAAVAEVSQTQNGIRIRMHSKEKALQMLGNYLGIFKDPIADSVTSLAERMVRAEARWKSGMAERLATEAMSSVAGQIATDNIHEGEYIPKEE